MLILLQLASMLNYYFDHSSLHFTTLRLVRPIINDAINSKTECLEVPFSSTVLLKLLHAKILQAENFVLVCSYVYQWMYFAIIT